jgi:hypothetical protein
MFSSPRILTKFVFLAAFVFCCASAVRAQINPANQIDWPTGASGCVYAPGTNTCVSPGGSPGNGVNETGSFTVAAGTPYQINCSAPCTATLPSSIATGFQAVLSVASGSSTVTVASGGPTYDGATSLAVLQSIGVWTDGTGYHSTQPTSGATIAHTSNVIKGDGAGNGVAATPGTDYVVPAGNVATATALAADGTNCTGTDFAKGVDASGSAQGCATPAGGGTSAPNTFDIATYGGVADGNFLANTGTDNTAAWVAAKAAAVAAGGGTVLFHCGQYRFLTNGPLLDSSGLGIAGPENCPRVLGTAGSSHSPVLFTSSATGKVVEVGGTSTSARTDGNSVVNLDLGYGLQSTGGAGLLVHDTHVLVVQNVNINDAQTCADITDAPAGNTGGFFRNNCIWNATGIAPPAGTVVGWYLHGGSSGFSTLRGSWNGAGYAGTCAGTGGSTVYGTKIDGPIIDLNWDTPTTSCIQYGLYADGTVGQDVHITNPQFDRSFTESAYIHIPGANSVDITGGQNSWITMADSSQTAGIELDNTPNARIMGIQCYSNRNIPCFYVHGVAGTGQNASNTISNNQCSLSASGTSGLGQCIKTNGLSGALIANNKIDGHSVLTFTLTPIENTGLIYSEISGNSISNGTGTGAGAFAISLDSTSHDNVDVNLKNNIGAWGTLNDLGTNNQLVGGSGITGATSGQALIAGSATTATSSKALAGTGAGITTGPTTSVLHNCPQFSNTSGQIEDSGSPCSGGSAFVTSLTTTGTSGPSTVVSGVLNIPQYTGGGGGATTNITNLITWSSGTVSNGQLTLPSDAATLDATSIPSGYNKLVIVVWGRAASSSNSYLAFHFNSDTTSSDYDCVFVGATSGSPFSGVCSANGITGTEYASLSSNAAGSQPATSTIEIQNYALSASAHAYSAVGGRWFASGNFGQVSVYGWWNNSTPQAITAIHFAPGVGNFDHTMFTISVYGVI